MDISTPNPQVVFSWKAPLRAYKQRKKWVLRFYLAVALLLSLIVFFFGDKILIIPIWAILFLFYILTITPPQRVENKITIFGIETAGVSLRWEALSHFYFVKRFDFEVLTFVGHAPYFYHAYMVVTDKEVKKKVMALLSEHLIYQEKPTLTVIDKIMNWFSSLIPDDHESEVNASPIPHPSSFSQK